jgi:hypothetical protein
MKPLEADSAVRLLQIDVKDTKGHLDLKQVNPGFVSEKIVKKLLANKKISERDIIEFQHGCKNFMVAVVAHLLEKCPIVYKLVRNMVCLDPSFIALQPNAACNKFKHVVNSLVEAKRLECDAVDSVRETFNNFVKKVKDLPEFTNFDRKTTKVDQFLFEKCQDYPELWRVIKGLLLLSHGQAAIERGFSVNKRVIRENQTQECLISLRIVKDHLAHVGGLSKLNVGDELLTYCSSARTRYVQFLEQQKEDQKNVARENKRKQCFEQTRELKRQCRDIECEVQALEKSAGEMLLNAEKKKDFSLLSGGNALRTKAEKEKELLKKTKSQLAAKEQALASL